MTLTIVWLLKWNQIICDFFILLSGIRWKLLQFNFLPSCPLSHSFSSFPFSPPPPSSLSLSFCQLHNSLWYKQNYCSLIEKCSVCFQCLAPMNKAVINIFVQRSLYMVLSFYGTWNLPIFLKSYHIISIEKVIDYATGISLFQIWFPWCVCPEVGLLGHMEVLFLVFYSVLIITHLQYVWYKSNYMYDIIWILWSEYRNGTISLLPVSVG